MREIKFRTWDKKNKKMIIPTSENCEHGLLLGMLVIGETIEHGTHEEFNHYEIMQFTGLRDKNGVEIYEGDIVEWYSATAPKGSNPMKRAVVKWNARTVSFENCHNGNVIGNIHQSPELLEESK